MDQMCPIIYLESTLALLAEINPERLHEIIGSPNQACEIKDVRFLITG